MQCPPGASRETAAVTPPEGLPGHQPQHRPGPSPDGPLVLLEVLLPSWNTMMFSARLEAPGSVHVQIFARWAMSESTLGIFPNEIKKP